ncbi:TIGR02206 family membrane protein [Halobacillus halophilus]|uniref:ABC-type transport system permease protein n=1 Tax=Halobacillus halophilus (strain ATCC 35676 / DSM 2266 / JCM 20832 / KCTC 3685 / LMG 17431 / NBRC 102448 / NCIMB 2269) TaxID=866895 RepID=I0JLJ1_HALH3|nr:TIGR02206 family membrane protein [Halobacillus halophilus]ASF39123.1 TIGR02206 family membrane protein [Halobacillus halophilus]CCG45011.1 ABC-type transport system permease protein [Halobacillus halophilus DSM 2266]
MPEWFNIQIQDRFEFLSTSHMIMLAILFSGIALLLIFHQTLQKNDRLQQIIRWTLFVLLLGGEIGQTIWGLANHNWNMEDHAPLHLCGIASILGMVALLFYRHKVIQILYFIGIIPPIVTLLTPEVFYSFPHFRFLKFFLHHMALAWTGIFLILVSSARVTFRSLLMMFGYLNLYAVFIFFLNRQIGTNYLFLAGTPDVSTPLDALGEGVWYYVNLELFCFGLFLGMYGLYRFISLGRNWKKRSGLKEEKYHYL